MGLTPAVELQAEHDDVLAGVDGGVAVAGSGTIQRARGTQKRHHHTNADSHRLVAKGTTATARRQQKKRAYALATARAKQREQ